MKSGLLEWIKVIGPIIVSWPTVAAVFVLTFRKPLLELLKRLMETPESSAKIGPIEFQLGKSVIPPQHHAEQAQVAFEKIDLSDTIGEIRNTGPEATTTGFAVAYAMQAAIHAKTGEKVTLSPRSVYAAAQQHDEWAGQRHEGTSTTGALKAMKKIGAYLESDWPYSNKAKPKPGTKPSYKISAYQQVQGVEGIVSALREGKVVVAAVKVPEDFFTPDRGR